MDYDSKFEFELELKENWNQENGAEPGLATYKEEKREQMVGEDGKAKFFRGFGSPGLP